MVRFIDNTLGKWLRHFFFAIVRTYFALFYNVSCSGKHLLQDTSGALILATHVSRFDGPLIAAILYTTQRIRPVVHYKEYYNWVQWFPMFVARAIPVSSPKSWPAEKRQAQKETSMARIFAALDRGESILLFPAGHTRKQEPEIIAPHLSGARDILQRNPGRPVLILRLEGLGRFQTASYDYFWTFIGRSKGRRHISVDIKTVDDLNSKADLAAFNQDLEDKLNTPIRNHF
ncbi:1-acyl-sn-glycerol-3-phosphate acyltransferase [Tateyamaria omphalii]|uniref:lysophospholipid acyltransferase family protein n=1 Tax=Tateyamaria omphalii TaxID=299262 RepID=UPI001C98FEAD|nr:1-acyl-sn-glycerol-3-phosphate acyltransferase [Tateyamaria omphalii]MBY5932640.1 1-acyl-sn-glycerol-3-phosphate acyltransferase [Tateyamaria omphalii]